MSCDHASSTRMKLYIFITLKRASLYSKMIGPSLYCETSKVPRKWYHKHSTEKRYPRAKVLLSPTGVELIATIITEILFVCVFALPSHNMQIWSFSLSSLIVKIIKGFPVFRQSPLVTDSFENKIISGESAHTL